MEEFESKRITNVAKEEVEIKVENCSYAWGFRVKEQEKKGANV